VDYITAQQAADKWSVSLRWVQTYLKNNRIDGVIRFGHAWMIPKDAEKPFDGRFKVNKRKEEKP
jgi:hypothetical protein